MSPLKKWLPGCCSTDADIDCDQCPSSEVTLTFSGIGNVANCTDCSTYMNAAFVVPYLAGSVCAWESTTLIDLCNPSTVNPFNYFYYPRIGMNISVSGTTGYRYNAFLNEHQFLSPSTITFVGGPQWQSIINTTDGGDDCFTVNGTTLPNVATSTGACLASSDTKCVFSFAT